MQSFVECGVVVGSMLVGCCWGIEYAKDVWP